MMDWFSSLAPILQGLLATLLTYFITLLGSLLVFFIRKINDTIIALMLSFASGVMIAASFWSLLSPGIEMVSGSIPRVIFEIGGGFLLGSLFVIISDVITKLIAPNKDNKNSLLVTAITIHNIPEGLIIGVAFGSIVNNNSNITILSALLIALGIGIQNFPEGLSVSLPLLSSGVSRKKAFFVGQLTAIVEPIFGMVGVLFAMYSNNYLPILLSFASGAMIAVACSELIPEAFKTKKLVATTGLMFGFLVMMLLDVILS